MRRAGALSAVRTPGGGAVSSAPREFKHAAGVLLTDSPPAGWADAFHLNLFVATGVGLVLEHLIHPR